MRRIGMRWWIACLLAVAWPAWAQIAPQDIPPPLRDWQGWVLHDQPEHDCPPAADASLSSQARLCTWPTHLALDAGNDGARFLLDAHLDAAGWLNRPGDSRHWPQQVSVDGKPAVVLDHTGQPSVWLERGDYTLRGNLPWTTRPPRLHVPTAIALVDLRLDGADVARVERNGDQLTLGEAAAAQRVADALSVRVYRRLEDGLPGELETRIQLAVAGSTRDVVLGPALPTGFVATALQGDLPARLESDGQLHVQLRPGNWTLSLHARALQPLARVTLTSASSPWPPQEVWSYADAPQLRSTRVSGDATDASQAGVPADWTSLPAYALDAAHGLEIAQGTRAGEGEHADELQLQREMWLDFDGHGLSVVDQLRGKLRAQQRLDVAAPWRLQRAAQGEQGLLITTDVDRREGVEVRDRALDLHAGLRLPEHSGALPVAGWQVALDGIDARLHLPFGYRLLGAPGVDRAPDTWIAQWSLLDLFVVALLVLLSGRWLGWRWVWPALIFLLLSQNENGAPRWSLGAALVLALLMRALPSGRLQAWSRWGAVLALAIGVLASLPFAAQQMVSAVHPQLENDVGIVDNLMNYEGDVKQEVRPPASVPPPPPAPSAPPAPLSEAAPVAAPQADMPEDANGALARLAPAQPAELAKPKLVSATAMHSGATGSAYGFDAGSVIQAGGGTPSWITDNNYRLSWSGPVTPGQTMRLVIAPAWLVSLLRVLMVALLFAWLAQLARSLRTPPGADAGHAGWWRRGTVAVAAWLALGLAPHAAHAQATPDQTVLNQLRARLQEAPRCAPRCASIAAVDVQARGDDIDLQMDIHAGAAVGVTLPVEGDALGLQTVTVDGHAAVLQREDQAPFVRLERGVHRVVLRYRAVATQNATLRFPLQPARVTFRGDGWSVDGVNEGRLLGDSLVFSRVHEDGGQAGKAIGKQAFPPYVRLTRSLVLGVDWTVENTVERIAPADGGFSIDLPLLPGEHPLGDDARVHDGRIGITFIAGSPSVSWRSRLDHAQALTLKAPPLDERAEVWQVNAGAIWHVDAQGVPVSESDEGMLFQPLPGEQLKLAISRPKAVAGQSVAMDSVHLSEQVGERATDAQLELRVRSTRGGEHLIALPAGATLLRASRDDQPLTLAIRDDKLGLPLLPGAHAYRIELRLPQGAALFNRTAQPVLGAPAANIGLHMELPHDRWVLWTWGPTDGPAVMIWAQLVVLLAAAWLLGRYAPTPLRFHQWFLLGLGFSATAWSAYVLVVVWLILFGLRQHYPPGERLRVPLFNLLQVGLIVLAVVALCVLVGVVPSGLLGTPDMHVADNDSSMHSLRWFVDQADAALPSGGVFSVSLWIYKLAMLAWALWLANALIGWLRWGYAAWTTGGYWRKRPKAAEPPPLEET